MTTILFWFGIWWIFWIFIFHATEMVVSLFGKTKDGKGIPFRTDVGAYDIVSSMLSILCFIGSAVSHYIDS